MEMKWSLNKREIFGVLGYASLLPLAIYIHSLNLFSFSVATVGVLITLPFSPIALLAGKALSGVQQSLSLNVFGCWLAMFFMSWFSLVQIKSLASKNNEKVSCVVLRVFMRSVIFIVLAFVVTAVAWWVFLP